MFLYVLSLYFIGYICIIVFMSSINKHKFKASATPKHVSKKRYSRPQKRERNKFDANYICGLKTPNIASSVVAKSKYRTKESKQLNIKLVKGINDVNKHSTIENYDSLIHEVVTNKFEQSDISILKSKVSKLNKFGKPRKNNYSVEFSVINGKLNHRTLKTK